MPSIMHNVLSMTESANTVTLIVNNMQLLTSYMGTQLSIGNVQCVKLLRV